MRRSVVGLVLALTCAACGPAPGGTTPSSSVAPRASATAVAGGPCATVKVTTPIADVPAACAALWAPYGVTKVPPADLLAGTPKPPPVVDETNGAVSQATADAWALALNHVGMWSQWSEANGQYGLTLHIEGPAVVNVAIDQAMRAGNTIIDPACDEFGVSYQLKPMDSALARFLAMYGETTHASFVFVASFPGPCEVDEVSRDGTKHVFASGAATSTVLPGSPVDDPVLGSIWRLDAGALCTKPGAPSSWCG